MPCSSSPLRAALAIAVVAVTADAGLSALRGGPSEAGEVVSVSQRALDGEDAHHHGNWCEGKLDGWRCKHDHAVLCQGGATVSHEKCAFHQECKEGVGRGVAAGVATATCEEDVCEEKADGFHCKDDHVVECAGLRTVNFTKCPFYQECKKDQLHPNAARCVEDVCEHKVDGSYCEDGVVVQCENMTTVNTTKCGITEECRKHALGKNTAACQEDACRGKANGSFCQHDGVVQCEGGRSLSFSKCPFYQDCKKNHLVLHAAACQEDACDGKVDGWRCKGDHVVQCSAQRTIDVEMCPSFKECNDEGMSAACV